MISKLVVRHFSAIVRRYQRLSSYVVFVKQILRRNIANVYSVIKLPPPSKRRCKPVLLLPIIAVIVEENATGSYGFCSAEWTETEMAPVCLALICRNRDPTTIRSTIYSWRYCNVEIERVSIHYDETNVIAITPDQKIIVFPAGT